MKMDLKKRNMLILFLCLLAIGIIIGLFFTHSKKNHKIGIYLIEKNEIRPSEYEELIEGVEPVITEKDIKAYNKEGRMIFLSDEIMNKHRDYLITMSDERLAEGGSVILGSKKGSLNNCFIITVDGKPVMGGSIAEALYSSFLPSNPFLMSDDEGGLRIGLSKHYNKEDNNQDYLKEEAELAKAFEEMGILTEDMFQIRMHGVTYNTDELWKNRTDFVGDNSKVGGIINNLVYPEGTSVASFSIESEKEPYSVSIHLGVKDGGDLSSYFKDYDAIFETNAYILFALVGNLNEVRFVIESQAECPEMVYINEKLFESDSYEDTDNEMVFPVESYFAICKTKYDFFMKFGDSGQYAFREDIECEEEEDK